MKSAHKNGHNRDTLTSDDIENLKTFADEWDIGRSLPGHIPNHVAYSLCERGYMERIKAGRAVRYRLTEKGKEALGSNDHLRISQQSRD